MAEIASAPPSRITLNIDWQPKSGGASKMPCPDCHQMLCAAIKDCGHEISLCNRNNEKKPLDCPTPQDDGPEDSSLRLKEAMGGVK